MISPYPACLRQEPRRRGPLAGRADGAGPDRAPGEPGFEALRREIAATTSPTGSSLITIRRQETHPPSRSSGKGARQWPGGPLRLPELRLPGTDHRPGAGGRRAHAFRTESGRQQAISRSGPSCLASATQAGTAAYALALRPRLGYVRALGSTGLVTSKVGFGGYRVDDETPEHREALERALLSGCNLIDTSTNYMDGGSERLRRRRPGRPRAAARSCAGRRSIVVSKIGYVQGQNLELAQEREAAGAAASRRW